MRVPLVKIGNSRGIRIPKAVIDACRLGHEVNLAVSERGLVITPVDDVRQGWSEAFRRMGESRDDALLDDEVATDWEDGGWDWK